LGVELNNSEIDTLRARIQSGIEQVKSKFLSENISLMSLLLIAEIKLFEYDRASR